MGEKVFRFSVATNSGQHSQSWKIWTHKNDCYLGSRGIAHDYKVSFHESGQCQVGLSREIRKTLVTDPSWEGKSRLFSEWNVDQHLDFGEKVKIIELLFPFSHLDDFVVPPASNEVKLGCGEGQIASVALFKARMSRDSVVKSEDDSVSEVGRLALTNGQSIVILHRVFEETEEYLSFFERKARSFKSPTEKGDGSGRTYMKGTIDPGNPNLRMMLWYSNKDGKYWIEMSYKKLVSG